MSKLAKALTAAAGNAGESLYVEDVFSTYLYDGNGSTQTIINGIDLDGEGGLVWHKRRTGTGENHYLYDTERGVAKDLQSNQTNAEGATGTGGLTSFNSNGYTYGTAQETGQDYASWTFRKAEKFFDVVTYTGNGTTQEISHNLGSTPACIIVKNTQSSTFWAVYHGSIPAFVGFLNATNAFDTSNTQNFGDNTSPVAPTDSVFTVGQQSLVNSDGETYVAYLFASDAGGFGDDGSENIIKCGSYTGNGSTDGPEIDLGFEPQFVMVKAASRTGHWFLLDVMRGIITGPSSNSPGSNQYLLANSSGAEGTTTSINVNSTGFQPRTADDAVNENAATYIYIAIRRPMKTPESGTEVFAINDNVLSDAVKTTSGITTDVFWERPSYFWERPSYNSGAAGVSFNVSQRLTRTVLQTQSTAAEGGPYGAGYLEFDYMDGFLSGLAGSINPGLFYSFKRATGFFDVVAYTGTGVSGLTVNHNLGVVPELMIAKRRNDTQNWVVYSEESGAGKYQVLNTTAGASTLSTVWAGVEPTASVFSVGNSTTVNFNGDNYIAYLFATVSGVSKVGSYTGTAADLNVEILHLMEIGMFTTKIKVMTNILF